jgi:protein required for attachment to host cells
MKKTWVVVANASQARCYRRETVHSEWITLAEFEDPMGRAKASQMPGERTDHEVTGRNRAGATAPRIDARTKERENFARRLAGFINESVATGKCESLVVFASNPFLGKVRACLNENSNRALGRSLAMDLTRFSGAELSRRIDQNLLAPG